ncbi:MAG: helix-turn-helix transcriptional regulator [Candidatus Saccharibacteria bacterium]|nr:helix-turn-helix transcriptional regulator [Pseudorhodobacter sp.]
MLDPLSQTLAALADPTRRAILLRLSQGEATVGALGAPFALSQPAISKHIKVLQAAGLISQSRAAQTRPCRLERAKLRDLDAFMDHFRAVTEGQLDQLETYLAEIQSSGETE